MDQNIETSSNSGVSPYKASGNLNTIISNPSANINGTMNVNIQTMQNSNPQQETVLQSTNSNQGVANQNQVSIQQQQIVQNNVNYQETGNINFVNQSNNQIPNQAENVNNYVKREYVISENNTKKKTKSFNIGPELKMALFIIIILLVFIFLLPLVPNFFRG